MECLTVNRELYNKGNELYERALFSSVIGAKNPCFRFLVLIDEGGCIFDYVKTADGLRELKYLHLNTNLSDINRDSWTIMTKVNKCDIGKY